MKKHVAMIPAYLWDIHKMNIEAGETVTLSVDGLMYTVEVFLPNDYYVPKEEQEKFLYYQVGSLVVVDRELRDVIPFRYEARFESRVLEGLGWKYPSDDHFCTIVTYKQNCDYVTFDFMPRGKYVGEPNKQFMQLAYYIFDRHTNKVVKDRYNEN